MPIFTAEIPETHQRINRPVIKQVVDDVLKRFKEIPFREFRFMGEGEQLATPGSAIDSGAFNRFDSDNYVDIEVIDEPDEEYGRSYVTTQNVNKALISCARTKLDMQPIYQNRKIVITLKVVCSSRVRLNGLITRIKQGMYQSQTLFTHKLSYDYDLPVPCTTLLSEIYGRMEARHGYGISFVDWLKEIKNPQVTLFSRLDGNKGVLGVRESSVEAKSGFTEHEEEPKKSKEEGNGVWSIELDIELRYQRPNVIRCSYPPIIHNQFLDEIWFNKNKTNEYRKEYATSSLGNMAIETFKRNFYNALPGASDVGFKEPYFDDWCMALHNKKIIKLVTCLVTVDECNRKNFFNVKNDIVDHSLPNEFVHSMNTHPKAIFYEGKHLIHVKAYSNVTVFDEDGKPSSREITIRPDCLSIDEDYNISVDYELDPRAYHHVIFSINKDPTTIPDDVWESLLCDKEALMLYFSLWSESYGRYLQTLIDEYGEDICFDKGVVDGIIKDIIEKGGGDEWDNGKLYVDYYARKTVLGYHVIGYKGVI